MKLVKEGAQQVLLDRLDCTSQAIDAIVLEVSELMIQREDCCYPYDHGLTNNNSLITNEGEIITLDIEIP